VNTEVSKQLQAREWPCSKIWEIKPTLSPHLLIPSAIARDILGALVLSLLLLIAAKHVLEELKLGLCDGSQQK
jgi:hypothetical protein